MRTPHSKEKTDDLQPVIDAVSHSMLGQIIKKAKQHQQLEKILKNELPETLASNCQLLNLRTNRIILATDNAAIATRIRFISADLLKHLKKKTGMKDIQSIECRVLPTRQD